MDGMGGGGDDEVFVGGHMVSPSPQVIKNWSEIIPVKLIVKYFSEIYL